jgi:hypothetical protein
MCKWDYLAKKHMPYAFSAPRHYSVKGEPWQIWVNGKKLTNKISREIYSLVHDKEAHAYWSSKKDANKEALQFIDRDAFGTVMREIMRRRRVFIMKHTAGM